MSPYVKSKLLENKKRTVPLTVASRKVKYSGINVMKAMRDVCFTTPFPEKT